MRWRSALVALAVCLVSILSVLGTAAGQALPQGIIPAPEKQKLSIDLHLDRDCFVPKQRMAVHLKVDRASYVYIYNIDSEGQVWLLFPNGFSQDARMSKGKHTLPDSDRYSIVIEGPAGIQYVQAIASPYPIPWLEYRGANSLLIYAMRESRVYGRGQLASGSD